MGSLPRDGEPIRLNGNIAVTCDILKLVASSADEEELGALFLNTKEARIVQLTIAKLGHPPDTNSNPHQQYHRGRNSKQRYQETAIPRDGDEILLASRIRDKQILQFLLPAGSRHITSSL